MATEKRFVHAQAPNKGLNNASLAIQLPTTSATNNDSIVFDHNRNLIVDQSSAYHNHNQHQQYQHRYRHRSNHQQYARNNADLMNYCHEQAATRGLLLDHHQHVLEPLTTTDSDESITPPPHYHEIPGIVPAYQGRTSGPPPAYDDVVNPNAPPPSYQSLFGQVREARKTSNGLVDLFRQLFLILVGTIGCTMIIGFLLLIPITMILVGIIYVNECRAENIPSLLVIGGLVWIVKNVLNCYNQFKKDSTTANRPPPRRAPISANSATVNGPLPNGSVTLSNTLHQNGATTTTAATAVGSNNSTANVLISSSQTTTQLNDNHDVNNNNLNTQIAIQPSHMLDVSSQTTINQTVISNLNEPTTTPTTTTMTTSSTQASSIAPNRTRSTTTREHQQDVNHIRQPSMIGLTTFKCESILNYFLIVWFLAGCIVVYRIYEPDYDNPMSVSYCNRTVYLYAFWLMTSAFIIMAIVVSCLCCLMASSLMSCNHGR